MRLPLHPQVGWLILVRTMTVSEPRPAFVPISPNPYIVGNPVRDRSMFFGREAEFESVRSRFQEAGDCGLLVFCGERRSGKTSILFQILDRRLGPEFIPVLIDMQSMAVTNETDFLGMIAEEVLVALGPQAEGIARPDFSQGPGHAAKFQRFIARTLRHCPDRKLILLFDEYELFEHKIDSGALSRDTLGILSNLMEHHSVFLVFTGSQHLDKRHRDYWNTLLAKSTWKQISYLERSDAERLIRDPVVGRVTFADGTVDAIFRLSAGQPFFTQAICQSLVDQLNERKTREVTHEILGEVVRGLVNNPLPQMIFLWDGLGQDEKLTLALLAETLSNDEGVAGDAALAKLIHNREYPLDLNRGRIAAALATLFRAELLTKDDGVQPPGYAFRMDLWRLWLRRMHSVWQVMREMGLEIRLKPGLRIGPYRLSPLAGGVAITALAVGALVLWLVTGGGSGGGSTGSGSIVAPTGNYALAVTPPDASIELPGWPPATGALRATLAAGQDFRILITAPGYEDTSCVARVNQGDSVRNTVSMRALLGDLLIQTTPPGAQVTVDATARGASPVMVRGLPLALPHEVMATMPGRTTIHDTARLTEAGKLLSLRLTLDAKTTDLVVTSEPTGATIVMDGELQGVAPFTVPGVKYGQHQFAIQLEGFTAVIKTHEVSDAQRVIHFLLDAEPPGILTIEGDVPATMYVDGERIATNVQNSKAQRLPPGTHQVRVVLASVDILKSIVIKSGERLVYDFSRDTVAPRP